MKRSNNLHTVDGRNAAPPGMCVKPCKYWVNYCTYQLVFRISQPAPVGSVFFGGGWGVFASSWFHDSNIAKPTN